MCSPIKWSVDTDPKQAAIVEIISAVSALTMDPEPMENINPEYDHFLRDTDVWVHHAVEHLQAALEVLRA